LASHACFNLYESGSDVPEDCRDQNLLLPGMQPDCLKRRDIAAGRFGQVCPTDWELALLLNTGKFIARDQMQGEETGRNHK
jgi:hypothetical protein